MKEAEFKEKMKTGLKKLNLAYEEEMLIKLYSFFNFLLEENRKYNLTGIVEVEDVISKHFLDSLALLPEIDLKETEKLIDIGTGAGFPGLVLKILSSSIKVTLLDSLQKRINFLNKLVKKIGLKEVELIHGRAEDFGQNKLYRESFSWVVSRAVAPVNLLSEYTLPFVKKSGFLIFYKGPDYDQELKEGEYAINHLGGIINKVKEVNVPGLNGKRYLVFIKKIKETPLSYPRRAGIPKKRPL